MTARQFFNIVELKTKVVSLATFTLAAAYTRLFTGTIPAGLLLLTGTAGLCIDMAVTGFNSYFDYLKGIDRRNRVEYKALSHDSVSPGTALLVSLILYAAAALLGFIIALQTSLWLIPAGMLCMAVGFFYSGGPAPLSSRPFGELYAGLFLGSVYFLIVVFILGGGVGREHLLASLPQSLIIAAILTVNNACDREEDREAGRRTLAILAGPRFSLIFIGLLYAAAYVLLTVAVGYDVLPQTGLAPLLSLPLAAHTLQRFHRRGFRSAQKGPHMQAILRLFAAFTGLWFLGLIVPQMTPLP